MLELRLHSGQVIAFDGRVLEVFADGETSRRFHVAQLPPLEELALEFAPEEAPARNRLLAALADARAAANRH